MSRSCRTSALLNLHSTHPLPPPQSPGTNFLNFAYLFLGGFPPLYSVLRPWAKKKQKKNLFIFGEKKNCLNHTNDYLSFVILEIYFFIILIADVLFIYLICIREPKHRKLYRLGLVVHWVWGPFMCD